ncbi:MAG: hypothetical protein EZS28_016784, partial [Streblomastix strix]
MGVSLR